MSQSEDEGCHPTDPNYAIRKGDKHEYDKRRKSVVTSTSN